MDTRKVSTALGFIILMGCIVAVVIVIYSGGSVRSYKSSVEESWKKRELWMREKERKDLLSGEPPPLPAQEILAKDFQKLFMKTENAPSGGNIIKVNGGDEPRPKIPTTSLNSSSGNLTGKGLLSTRTSFNDKQPSSSDGNRDLLIPTESTPENRYQHQHHNSEIPSINSKLDVQDKYRDKNINDRSPPRQQSVSMSTGPYPSGIKLAFDVKPPSRDITPHMSPSKGPEWDMDYEDLLLDSYEQQYLLDEEEDFRAKDPLQAMGNIVQLVTDVYKKGTQSLDVNGFLKVINETVQIGNNSRLLSQLNQLYKRPGNLSLDSSAAVGRNAIESSISAFVFMSFGIFLLNQIHNFMGTGENKGRQGRNLESNDLDDSELDFLFQPPLQESQVTSTENIGNSTTSTSMTTTTINSGDKNNDHLNETGESASREPFSSSDNVDNMFRAALNLVNAYTKDTSALECIWSKYCYDLDKTASKRGSLYSLAARINSIGLRLIMGQIPKELTVDVMLRSLLGWDGLPCHKMFTECKINGGSLKENEQVPVPVNGTLS